MNINGTCCTPHVELIGAYIFQVLVDSDYPSAEENKENIYKIGKETLEKSLNIDVQDDIKYDQEEAVELFYSLDNAKQIVDETNEKHSFEPKIFFSGKYSLFIC